MENSVGVAGDLVGEEDGVVLPLGVLVDPEVPAFVGDQGSVFRADSASRGLGLGGLELGG